MVLKDQKIGRRVSDSAVPGLKGGCRESSFHVRFLANFLVHRFHDYLDSTTDRVPQHQKQSFWSKLWWSRIDISSSCIKTKTSSESLARIIIIYTFARHVIGLVQSLVDIVFVSLENITRTGFFVFSGPTHKCKSYQHLHQGNHRSGPRGTKLENVESGIYDSKMIPNDTR